MDKKKLSAFDVYLTAVFRWGNLLLVSAAMCASILYGVFKITGLLEISTVAIVVFIIQDIIYFCFCIWMVRTSIDENGYLKNGRLKMGKLFTSFVVIVQWNYILYMVKSRTFFGFLFFFIILIAFYLDMRMIIINGVACIGSLVVSWFITGNNLPVKDEIFVTDLIMIIVGIVLSMAGILFFVFFMKSILVNAKKDEMEKNNQRVEYVLHQVMQVTTRLGQASQFLVSTSQNESASTEELSAISENLLDSNKSMLEKSEQSKENLNVLEESSQNMERQMQEVDKISMELSSISSSNEKNLSQLMSMSERVEKSTSQTMEVTQKLLMESGEIGKTLDIINEIAESINLLALNASIEAARAGEAGRGFAVVAQEVGHLAESTKDSLKSVNEVVTRVQNGTNEVSRFINENAEQLTKQNQVIGKTTEGIRTMMELLKKSADSIAFADQIREEQNQIIGETVKINENIAERIQTENSEFTDITQMVQSNSQEIVGLSEQIDNINSMVTELEDLLQDK